MLFIRIKAVFMNRKTITYVVISSIFFLVLIIGFVYSLARVYSENVSVLNNTSEEIVVGIVTYCYECDPGEYREVHKSQIIKPGKEGNYNVWWDDENFDTPIFFRVDTGGSKTYFCGEAQTTFQWSSLEEVKGASLAEIGEKCRTGRYEVENISHNKKHKNVIYLIFEMKVLLV